MGKRKPAAAPPDAPEKLEQTGGRATNQGPRDAAGRFAPGWRGGGRPRGIDFRRLVIEKTKDNGSVEEGLFAVYLTLMALATKKGDVTAAKLLLDRLCLKDEVDEDPAGGLLTHEERLRRLTVLLGLGVQKA